MSSPENMAWTCAAVHACAGLSGAAVNMQEGGTQSAPRPREESGRILGTESSQGTASLRGLQSPAVSALEVAHPVTYAV